MEPSSSGQPYGYRAEEHEAESFNPFAPSTQVDETLAEPAADDVRAYRQYHIAHEASVKSIGLLHWLSGAIMLLAGIGLTVGSVTAGGPDAMWMLIFGGALAVFGGLWIWLGVAIRRLNPIARIVTCIVSVIGLLSFPVGTLINGYFLYLLLSQKGQAIFDPSYQRVIEATPDIKYQTSKLVWVVLIIFVAFIGVAIAAVFIGS
ncbi:hypothetical protein [Rhodopirellula sallentina]|uniref:Putative membrane protein n=1 Tax=Rhodopirellula sallentina SM41 TaxID=1263870 RepID=M5U5B5_9BACT|nr:hypothetical protein [Rhodopirellula sallentina]EMI53051.1 putative membrane protein [Rhodopirellula sallentina SM41]